MRLLRPAEVFDQASVGSCVAQSLALAVAVVGIRQELPERPDRTALYHRARRAIGTVSEDSGAIIADGIEVLRRGWGARPLAAIARVGRELHLAAG